VNCDEAGMKTISSQLFGVLLKSKKISIFKPRKDMCNMCYAHDIAKNGTIADDEYEMHRQWVSSAKDEKSQDKASASDTLAVFSYDKQAILQSPLNSSNLMYYKSKLNVNNVTIMEMRNADVMNYLWCETEGDNCSSVFASIYYNHYKSFLVSHPQVKKLILWSDNCAYQNKSAVISTAFMLVSSECGVEIDQKYLYVGHTMMEVDSAHARIEMAKKGQDIALPSDYIDIIKSARKVKDNNSSQNKPYGAEMLSFDFFLDFNELSKTVCSSIRPPADKQKKTHPHVNDIHALRYTPDGRIMYKLNFRDDWMPLEIPSMSADCLDYQLPRLFSSRLSISKSKFQHLMQLKAVVPQHSWEFYDDLPVQ
jgi:hypothetical protein